ncbi:inositol-3-phosphate synthase [Nonomuraea bangladeshensis]|uniref:inositol-3-phosphate synthase n=1 Tax=Nonomuraea bangladeshensis TaxID=404385 RepID=UPI0031D885CC
MNKLGVWLIGARGSVATTAIVGASAVRAGAATSQGCVSEAPGFPGDLAPPGGLVFGGHDITETSLRKRAEQLGRAGVAPAELAARQRVPYARLRAFAEELS